MLADPDPSATGGVDAPGDDQRTAAPAAPAKSADKYADHDWSASENDIPGTSSSDCSDDDSTCNATHRHARERRERAEDKKDEEMTLTGQTPPERHRWKQTPLRSRNDRYKAQTAKQLSQETSVASSS